MSTAQSEVGKSARKGGFMTWLNDRFPFTQLMEEHVTDGEMHREPACLDQLVAHLTPRFAASTKHASTLSFGNLLRCGTNASHSTATRSQRVWKTQPGGGSLGLGISPVSGIRFSVCPSAANDSKSDWMSESRMCDGHGRGNVT